MKFKFKIQDYQTEAVNSVVNVFRGQPRKEKNLYRRDLGKINQEVQTEFTTADEYEGYKNHPITLNEDNLLSNINSIQKENNIHLSSSLNKTLGACSIDVEMETGTGKTYCYLKTAYELNKLYGWNKFIIVVPSIAIREGVSKSMEMTSEHFMSEYGKRLHHFTYDSKHLQDIDDYSKDFNINIMIINIQAFNREFKEGKSGLIMYSRPDRFASRRPIDVISSNRPIVILDEPQKMDTDKALKSISNFNPLFSINYSATHTTQHNLVYVLDALDAYNKRLVKKIEVKGFDLINLKGTERYLYLDKIDIQPNQPPVAKIELEVKQNNGIKRKIRNCNVGDDLYVTSNELEQYKGYTIGEINYGKNEVSFLNGEKLTKGKVINDLNNNNIRRIQIRETIKSHFEKERFLFEKGIKTLSLFFIDEVSKYRLYDEEGNELLGEYGKIFEEEYINILNEEKTLFDNPDYIKYLEAFPASSIHNGYFSVDKKGKAINSKIKRGQSGSDDISAYDLILKNKERLLSFEEPTRFVFSHSALREGWDNPNVFQICTLKHTDSNIVRRQEVGRGLRLCVNQSGDRMDRITCGDNVHNINLLTVVTNESYSNFVNGLQKETIENLTNRPKKAEVTFFVGKKVSTETGDLFVTEKQAKMFHHYLAKNEYIDYNDQITSTYKDAVENNNLKPVPEECQAIESGLHLLMQSIFDEKIFQSMIQDGNKVKTPENKLNDNFSKKEFQKLWGYINHHYSYSVEFDSEELIKKAVAHINNHLLVSEVKYVLSKGSQKDNIEEHDLKSKTSITKNKQKVETLSNASGVTIRYDLLGKIAEGTLLTRRTVARILSEVSDNQFNKFKNNPEEFISKVIKLINEQKATMIVEHITYNVIEGKYDSDIFTSEKKTDFIDKAIKVEKSIQDYLFTDGLSDNSVEKRFAEQLEVAEEVCVYAKLPKGFTIPTPVGKYSPDWAIAFNQGSVKHIYFVAETKGSMESLQLRPIEEAKINCAKKLFESLSNEKVKYHEVDTYENLLQIVEPISNK